MQRRILVNRYPGLLSRIVVLEDSELVAFEWEPDGAPRRLGQIHRGTVMREAKGLGGVSLMALENISRALPYRPSSK